MKAGGRFGYLNTTYIKQSVQKLLFRIINITRKHKNYDVWIAGKAFKMLQLQ